MPFYYVDCGISLISQLPKFKQSHKIHSNLKRNQYRPSEKQKLFFDLVVVELLFVVTRK